MKTYESIQLETRYGATLDVEFTIFEEAQTWEHPGSREISIDKIEYNGRNVSRLIKNDDAIINAIEENFIY